MKRHEIERLLMEEGGREILARRAAYLRDRYGERGPTGGEPADRTRRVGTHDVDIHFPTPEEFAANDADFQVRTSASIELSRFVHGLDNEDPRRVLKIHRRQAAKRRSEEHVLLTESAINRILAGAIKAGDEELIEEAIEELSDIDRPDGLEDEDNISQAAEEEER